MSANPFEPPEASRLPGSAYVFRPLRGLTLAVGVAVLLDVLFLFGVAITNGLLVEHDPGVFQGNDPADEASTALAIGLFLSSIGYLLAYIVGGILFCMWLVRASKNARALGARGMEFTPGWTAGWFFVPVLNLVRPYEAIKELYQASDPESGSTDWAVFEAPGFILAWWVSWIGFTLVGPVAQNFWNLPFLTAILGAVSAVLAIRVLIAIERRQMEKKARPVAVSAPVTEEVGLSSSNPFL